MNIMFICLLITYTIIGCSKCSDDILEIANGMEILPESMANGQNILLRRVEDTLNLTCRVFSNKHAIYNNVLPKHKLSWHLPHVQLNSQNRVLEQDSHNSRGLIIEHLQETDTGDYECQARLDSRPDVVAFRESVRVNVKNKKGFCGEQMFQCGNRDCIAKRYVCDGKDDCKDGGDESEQNCGPRPCEGKVPCDGRCIPAQWCCDQHRQENCTVKVRPACCGQYLKHPGFVPSQDFQDLSEQQRFNEMGFLQTTIYTVIGCAMAFMFIVTILVIAICRVHMKRSLLGRCSVGRGGAVRARGVPGQQVPLYDLDVFLNRSAIPQDSSPHSGLLVTYNINNGIQFVGRPVDPPPYCEVVASPPREGPPPPYASREDLAREYEPLLETVTGSTLRITVVNPSRARARVDQGHDEDPAGLRSRVRTGSERDATERCTSVRNSLSLNESQESGPFSTEFPNSSRNLARPRSNVESGAGSSARNLMIENEHQENAISTNDVILTDGLVGPSSANGPLADGVNAGKRPVDGVATPV